MTTDRKCRGCLKTSTHFYCRQCWRRLPVDMQKSVEKALKNRLGRVEDFDAIEMASAYIVDSIAFDSRIEADNA